MIIIHYTPYTANMTPHSPIAMTDAACERAYANILDRYQNYPTYDQNWCVASENFYERIRVGIAEGELRCTDVVFIFGDQELHPNRFGQLEVWPDGFCDYTDKLRERLLVAMFRVSEDGL